MLLLIHIKDYDAAQGRPVLRGPQGEGPRAGHHLRRDAGRSAGPIATSASTSGPTSSGGASIEASYLEDARVGEVLRQRGKTLEAIAYLLDLWRDVSRHGVDRERLLRPLAGPGPGAPARPITDPDLRRELAAAGVTRSELLLQAIRLIQVVPRRSRPRTRWPTRRAWPWSAPSSSWRTSRPSSSSPARFAKLYPKSTFLDSFQYSEALGRVPPRPVRPGHRGGRGDRRGDLQGRQRRRPAEPEQVAGALHPRPDLRRPPPAGQGAGVLPSRSPTGSPTPPARSSRCTRKELKLPEVSVDPARPAPAVAGGAGAGLARRRAAPRPKAADEPTTSRPRSKLDYRNIAEADVKVYPVDLMRLYLTRRNLDAIAGIDLAGITPLFETTVKLGDGADLRRQGPGRSTCR